MVGYLLYSSVMLGPVIYYYVINNYELPNILLKNDIVAIIIMIVIGVLLEMIGYLSERKILYRYRERFTNKMGTEYVNNVIRNLNKLSAYKNSGLPCYEEIVNLALIYSNNDRMREDIVRIRDLTKIFRTITVAFAFGFVIILLITIIDYLYISVVVCIIYLFSTIVMYFRSSNLSYLVFIRSYELVHSVVNEVGD